VIERGGGGIPVMVCYGWLWVVPGIRFVGKWYAKNTKTNPPHVMPITLKLLSVLPTGQKRLRWLKQLKH